MKTCPICKTMLFDDMETCYGCMYTFGSKPDLEREARTGAGETAVIAPVTTKEAKPDRTEAPDRQDLPGSASIGQPLPLALLAQITSSMPGWGIRLEMHDETTPERIWSMELTPPRVAAAG